MKQQHVWPEPEQKLDIISSRTSNLAIGKHFSFPIISIDSTSSSLFLERESRGKKKIQQTLSLSCASLYKQHLNRTSVTHFPRQLNIRNNFLNSNSPNARISILAICIRGFLGLDLDEPDSSASWKTLNDQHLDSKRNFRNFIQYSNTKLRPPTLNQLIAHSTNKEPT